MMNAIAQTVQVISVVVGVVLSVVSFNATRLKEAEARSIEASKPFLELRQKLYVEALKQAAVLTNPETHTPDEVDAAKKRFRELYVAELSMVEDPAVESKMVGLAAIIDSSLTKMTPGQHAAYDLAHALRDSFIQAWKLSH